MSTVVRQRVGDALMVRSGAHRVAVPPGRTHAATVAGSSEVQIQWTAPATGGAAITGYTVRAYDPDGALVSSSSVDGTTFSKTVTGLTNDVRYTFTVKATNSAGTGPESPEAGATPSATVAIKPVANNTGVAVGLPGDDRALATLTHAADIPAASWFSRNSSSGYPRFIVKAKPPGNLLDLIDFTDYVFSLTDSIEAVDGITIRRCLFHNPTVKSSPPSLLNPIGKPPANLVNITFPIQGVTFDRCTFNGLTFDQMNPASNVCSYSEGSTDILYDNCRALGMSNAFVASGVDGFTVRHCAALGLTSYRALGWVKNLAAAARAAGSGLGAGRRYFQISAVIHNTSLGDFQTLWQPLAEFSLDMAAGDVADLSWTAYSTPSSYPRTGYRIYVGSAPGVYDGFFTAVAGDTTATYTGQALSGAAAYPEYTYSHGHPDCTQFQSNYVRNVTVENNNMSARTPDGFRNCAGLQVGSMTNQKEVENVLYQGNWIDGSSSHFNCHPPETFIGDFIFRGNRLGTDLGHEAKNSQFQAIIDSHVGALWEDNVWDYDGTLPDGTPVLAGQVIP